MLRYGFLWSASEFRLEKEFEQKVTKVTKIIHNEITELLSAIQLISVLSGVNLA